MTLADILLHEYPGMTRERVWWGIGMGEIAMYVNVVRERKIAEAGKESDDVFDDSMADLIETIQKVRERNRKCQTTMSASV